MKTILTLTISTMMIFGGSAQSKYYDTSGGKKLIKKNEITVNLTERGDSPTTIGVKNESLTENESATLLASLLPLGIDLAFKTIGKELEKEAKRYVSEYNFHSTYLKLYNNKIPDIHIVSKVTLENGSEDNALEIKLKAYQVRNPDTSVSGQIKELPFAYFSLEMFRVKWSKAKTKAKYNLLNYVMEITPVFYLLDAEKNELTAKKAVELSPIQIPLASLTEDFKVSNNQYRTGFFNLPKNALFAEVSVKLVESNPYKVKAEKMLEVFNTHKDEAKTIINNILPESKSEDSSGQAAEPTGDDSGSVSNK